MPEVAEQREVGGGDTEKEERARKRSAGGSGS